MTLSKGQNKLSRYKQLSLLAMCGIRVKEINFKTKYRPAVILLPVNGVIYFRFKLKLKFRSKKSFFSVIVNVYIYKYLTRIAQSV